MATAATPDPGGGTTIGVKAGNNETSQQTSMSQKEHHKKKRNRSRKKRGKGGVGDVGDGGGGRPGAQGSPAADAGFAVRQKQKQRSQLPTQQRKQQPQPHSQSQQRDRGQRHRNKKETARPPAQRPTQGLPTAPQPCVPPATITVAKRAPTSVSDTTDLKDASGEDTRATLDTSNVVDAGHHLQASPSPRVALGTSTLQENECKEQGDAIDGSIRHETDLVTRKGTTMATEVLRDVAPFECSWTTASNSDDRINERKSPKQADLPCRYNQE